MLLLDLVLYDDRADHIHSSVLFKVSFLVATETISQPDRLDRDLVVDAGANRLLERPFSHFLYA